jgi:prepilin-type processing-associated H-X9-DG protein
MSRRTVLGLMLCGTWSGGQRTAAAQAAPTWQALTLSAPVQTIPVQSRRQSWTAVFQTEAQVFANGSANGFLILSDPVAQAATSGVNAAWGDGSVRFSRTGAVLRVMLRGKTPDGAAVAVSVTPSEIEDCLIYTTVGTQLTATWMADGRITLLR